MQVALVRVSHHCHGRPFLAFSGAGTQGNAAMVALFRRLPFPVRYVLVVLVVFAVVAIHKLTFL
jgi:hypothetical protein